MDKANCSIFILCFLAAAILVRIQPAVAQTPTPTPIAAAVSQQQAIGIAMSAALNSSVIINDVPILGFKFQNYPVAIELTMQPAISYPPSQYRPWYNIFLVCDKSYNGLTSFQVTLWGDTGEVTHVVAITMYRGGPSYNAQIVTYDPSTPPFQYPSPSPTLSPSPTATPQTTMSPAPTFNPYASPSLTQQPTESPSVSQTPEPTLILKQQSGFLGTTLPLEYGYTIMAVLVVAVVAGTSLVLIRNRRKR